MSNQQKLTQDAVTRHLQTITSPTAPSSARSASHRGVPAWKRVRVEPKGNSRAPTAKSRAAKNDDYSGLDEEAANRRRYWEKFAQEATKELLWGNTDREEAKKKEELLYSARISTGTKFGYSGDDDDESVATELSLLTCSRNDVIESATNVMKRRRKKKKEKEEEEEKTNWEEYAKERQGALAKLMRQDASNLQSVDTKGNGFRQRRNVIDIMTEEERDMLMRCAYFRGLAGREKSGSTANIVTGGDIKSRPPVIRVNSRPMSRGSTPGLRTPLPPGAAPTGRTPSPQDISRKSYKVSRSTSLQPGLEMSGCSRTRSATSRRSACSRVGMSPFSLDERPMTAPDIGGTPADVYRGTLSRQLTARVHSTLTALERLAGYGDPEQEIRSIQGEKGRYTGSDYARIPRYPRNIRVAPQLARVIGQDVVERMGRPRFKAVTSQDIDKLDKTQPNLDRSHRNLVIFNWLGSIDEDTCDVISAGHIDTSELRKGSILYNELRNERTASKKANVKRNNDDVNGDVIYSEFASEADSQYLASDDDDVDDDMLNKSP